MVVGVGGGIGTCNKIGGGGIGTCNKIMRGACTVSFGCRFSFLEKNTVRKYCFPK